jgi:hypothetical protein
MLHEKNDVDWFFEAVSVHVLTLPKTWIVKNQTATIMRSKIWNLSGRIWIESEIWGFETNKIQRTIKYLGDASKLKKISLDIAPSDISDKDEITQQFMLFSLETPKIDPWTHRKIQEMIVSRLVQKLLKIKEKPRLSLKNLVGKAEPQEQVYIIPEKSFDTIKELRAENLPDGRLHILTEEIEGCLTSIDFGLQETAKGIFSYQEITDPTHNVTLKSLKKEPIQLPQEAFIPLKTLENLIKEEILWNELQNRSDDPELQHDQIGSFIHNSSDYWRIKTFFSKSLPQEWADKTAVANNHSIAALIYTGATIPEINKNISTKLIRHHVQSGDFEALYNGGLINTLIFKNAWAWGWETPITDTIPEKIRRKKNTCISA